MRPSTDAPPAKRVVMWTANPANQTAWGLISRTQIHYNTSCIANTNNLRFQAQHERIHDMANMRKKGKNREGILKEPKRPAKAKAS